MCFQEQCGGSSAVAAPHEAAGEGPRRNSRPSTWRHCGPCGAATQGQLSCSWPHSPWLHLHQLYTRTSRHGPLPPMCASALNRESQEGATLPLSTRLCSWPRRAPAMPPAASPAVPPARAPASPRLLSCSGLCHWPRFCRWSCKASSKACPPGSPRWQSLPSVSQVRAPHRHTEHIS